MARNGSDWKVESLQSCRRATDEEFTITIGDLRLALQDERCAGLFLNRHRQSAVGIICFRMSLNPATPTPSPAALLRSLDELADTPEFKAWLHREFPQGATS